MPPSGPKQWKVGSSIAKGLPLISEKHTLGLQQSRAHQAPGVGERSAAHCPLGLHCGRSEVLPVA